MENNHANVNKLYIFAGCFDPQVFVNCNNFHPEGLCQLIQSLLAKIFGLKRLVATSFGHIIMVTFLLT